MTLEADMGFPAEWHESRIFCNEMSLLGWNHAATLLGHRLIYKEWGQDQVQGKAAALMYEVFRRGIRFAQEGGPVRPKCMGDHCAGCPVCTDRTS